MTEPQQRPFVANPSEWEVLDDVNDLEPVDEAPAKAPPTWSERLGLHEPTASPAMGFVRGAGTGLVDMLQGAVSNVTGQMNSKLDAENALRQANALPQTATAPRVAQPGNISGSIGGMLPDVGLAMIGGPPVANAAKDALPSAARAGANFEKVMGAAQDVPVDVGPAGEHALRIMDLSERGASFPKSVRDLLKRITDPAKPAMTYRESRDFASNLSSLSANEKMAIKPVVRREIAQLAADMNKANAEAAKAAGRGAEYKSAMREYANAMELRDALDTVLKHSKKAAIGAAGLGAAGYLAKDLLKD